MSGYFLIPRHVLDLYGGTVPTAPERMGFFDFLREIEQEPFPFKARAGICITGLDELLITLNCTEKRGGNRELELLRDYHRRLKHAAVEIGSLADIQVPIAHELVFGGDNRLTANHTPTDRVPLWRIFGHNPIIRDGLPRGLVGYQYGENLS
jgi:hypothetical protein